MNTRSRSRCRRSSRWLWSAVISAVAAVAGGPSRPTFATQDAAPTPVDAGPAVYDAPLPHVDRADARLADAAGPLYDAPLPHVEGAPPPSDGAAPTERGCACALEKNASHRSGFPAIGVPLLLVLFAWRPRWKRGRHPSRRPRALPLVALLSVVLAACGQPPASGADPDSGDSATPPLVRTPEVGPSPAPGHDSGAPGPLADGPSPTGDAMGLKDSTDAIQEAMDDAYHAAEKGGPDRGVVFFPPAAIS